MNCLCAGRGSDNEPFYVLGGGLSMNCLCAGRGGEDER